MSDAGTARRPGPGIPQVDVRRKAAAEAGAAAHVLQSLTPDGTWLIVEPFAGDDVADNLTPVGRVFYSASTLICTPASLSQEVGAALGAQAGEARLREAVTAGGFTRFRRAAETPFNLVLDATFPNWRLSVSGGEAVRSQLAQWYADPGEFQTLRRTPLPQGELVEFTLTWTENGVPHTCHQAHILEIADGLVSTDTMWCGGRWPASLMAEMSAAS